MNHILIVITKLIYLCIFTFGSSVAYQAAGLEMTSKAVIGKQIDSLSKQYIICQDINNKNIYYSFFTSYKKQWFTNKSIIKEYKLYILKVEDGKVVAFYEAPSDSITTDIINEIRPTTSIPSINRLGFISSLKENFAAFSPLG